MKTFFFFFFFVYGDRLKNFCEDFFFFFFGEHLRLCPWSLALASSIPVLGLESVCPRKGCPWLRPRIFLCPWPWPWPRALCPRLHLWLKLHGCACQIFRQNKHARRTFLLPLDFVWPAASELFFRLVLTIAFRL